MVSGNYHTHHQWCRHATGSAGDYCAAAEAAGLKILAMTDHVPYPGNLCWLSSRMDWEQLGDYMAEVDAAAAAHPALKVYRGLECEYRPELGDSFYRERLRGEYRAQLLLGSLHYVRLDNGDYLYVTKEEAVPHFRNSVKQTVALIHSGLFDFLAHPDLCLTPMVWGKEAEMGSREILQALKDTGMPAEINGYGMRKPPVVVAGEHRYQYPRREFWELAGEYGIRCVVNSDAHAPSDVAASLEECESWAVKNHLEIVNDAIGALCAERA